jgi:signal transduction histidine kinase
MSKKLTTIRGGSQKYGVAVIFWIALGVLSFLTFISYTAHEQAYDNGLWVEHTQQVNLEIEELTTLYLSARAAWRNYLTAGSDIDLRIYEESVNAVPLKVASLQSLTRDNPRQKDRIDALAILLSEDIAAIGQDMEKKRSGRYADPAAPFAPDLNWQKIKHISEMIQAEEKKLLAQRSREWKSSTERLVITIISGSLASFVMLMLVFYLLRKEVEQRRAAQEALAESERHFRLVAEAEKAANKELESFSYTVSHDLRSPLRAINGFSRILKEDYADKLDDEGLRLLQVIRDNSNRMGSLIDDLLAFSRLGRKPVAKVQIDMTALAQAVKEELRDELKDRPVQIIIHPLPPALGDPVLIRQVWTNLLANAIKFTGHVTSARIEVGASEAEQQGTAANVYYVKDNGAGFDMRYYGKLFGIFHRLHRDDEFPGTGVGLAIVHRVVMRHDGRVWAEGRVNHGATFFFELSNDHRLEHRPEHRSPMGIDAETVTVTNKVTPMGNKQ